MKEKTAKPYYFDCDIKGISFLKWSNYNNSGDDFKDSFCKSRITFTNISTGRSF